MTAQFRLVPASGPSVPVSGPDVERVAMANGWLVKAGAWKTLRPGRGIYSAPARRIDYKVGEGYEGTGPGSEETWTGRRAPSYVVEELRDLVSETVWRLENLDMQVTGPLDDWQRDEIERLRSGTLRAVSRGFDDLLTSRTPTDFT